MDPHAEAVATALEYFKELDDEEVEWLKSFMSSTFSKEELQISPLK